MKTISDILFIISNGLLIPVVLLLLYLLIRALYIALGFYNEYITQRRITKILKESIQDYSSEKLSEIEIGFKPFSKSIVVKCFRDLMSHRNDKIYCEHELANYQIEVQKSLSKNRTLLKFGPMLGLMGTLIPMGPALVGLAVGDIASMAYNMQVAFATTVIGMLVAAVGLATLQVSRRFYARSLNDLEFLYNKMTE